MIIEIIWLVNSSCPRCSLLFFDFGVDYSQISSALLPSSSLFYMSMLWCLTY